MRDSVPDWLPDWLKEALTQPTMDIPVAGRAVYAAERHQSYALARQNVMPTIKAGRRRRVPTIWVRRQLMIDEDPPAAA
jgi:hypothetical protein